MGLFLRRKARSRKEATTLIRTIMSKMQICTNHNSIKTLLTACGISRVNGPVMDKTVIL